MADEFRMLIGSEWVASESGATFEATAPATGEVIGTLPEGTRADAQRAIEAAGRAFDGWSGLSAFARAAAMRRIAEAIDRRRDELARTLSLDQGKPLEMGGNGPLVICEDADLDAAVEGTLEACFLNAGQSCTAGERILVHQEVHDAYVEQLTSAVADRIRLGDPFDAATTMGPLNNPGVADKTERHVNQAAERGAAVVSGGKRAPRHGSDLFFEATVIDGVTGDMEVAREETFGPVVPISTIESEEEAIRIVDGSPYGLLAAIYTRDLGRGLRFAERVRTGWVNVNEGTNYWESHLPFGGRAGSASGVGRVGGRFSMERLTELKTVVIHLG